MPLKVVAGVLAATLVLGVAGCAEDGDPAIEPGARTVPVYVAPTGSDYHLGACEELPKNKMTMALPDAKAAGYKPCPKCNPPR